VSSLAAELPPERGAGPRSSKGARTRARLLSAAKEIFEENGFLEARISDIAERAGLSHGSFYTYFDSKEQIFREVAAAVDDDLGAPLSDVILSPSSSGRPPQDRLREALRQHFETYRQQARIMGIIEEVSRYDDHVRDLLLARHRQYTGQVAESIRQMQKRGMADRGLNPTVAAAVVGALTGRFAELWLVQGAVECSFDEAVEQVTRLIVNALGVERASS
jgi:AcrR family transcriptional regulator